LGGLWCFGMLICGDIRLVRKGRDSDVILTWKPVSWINEGETYVVNRAFIGVLLGAREAAYHIRHLP